MSLSALLVPGILLFVGLWGLSHRVDEIGRAHV